MENTVWHYLPFDHFFDPNKRIYWPYLALSVFYALIFIWFSRTQKNGLKINYWFNKSTLNDVIIWIGNHIIQLTIFPLLFISSLSLASRFYHFLNNIFGEFQFGGFPYGWGIVLYSVSYFLLSDFTRFILHYLMHHNQFLWSIHRMHHTAESLTPITFFRVHPFEMVLFHLRFLLIHGIVTGTFIYLFSEIFDFPTIFGSSFFVFFTNVLGGNLRHSNIPIGFGIFERFLVSPKQHQMHHSKELDMQQSNYGSFFSFWDRLFSTWKSSKGVKEIQYGIKEETQQSLVKDLLYPLFGTVFKIKKRS